MANSLFSSLSKDDAHTIFINNAGSLGPLTLVDTIATDNDVAAAYSSISTTINLNVTMCCFLSSEFARRVKLLGASSSSSKFTIVNVSSLAAVQAFETWGIYCAGYYHHYYYDYYLHYNNDHLGKAAREMFHKVLALEQEKNEVKIRVLNYAPGPLDTDMQKEIRESATVDEETRKYFATMKEEKKLVNPDDSAEKMMRVILATNYDNGAHIDYFDPELPLPSTV